MLNNLEKTPLRPYWYLSVLFIALGVYGSLSEVLPLTWIWFIVGGALAIITQFNFETLKISMGKMEKGSWKIIFWSIILTFIASFATMALGNLLFHTGFVENSNAVHTGPILARIQHLVLLSISLIGEELITASVAFPLYHLLAKKMSSKQAWIIAGLISAILFGLMHLKIYHGNLYQCIVVIGLTRLPFNYAWRKTNSLWGGIIGHVIYDLVIFIPAMFIV